MRSSEGKSAFLVLSFSTEPFTQVVEEAAEESVRQAWDMNGLAKVDRPKTAHVQVCLIKPLSDLTAIQFGEII